MGQPESKLRRIGGSEWHTAGVQDNPPSGTTDIEEYRWANGSAAPLPLQYTDRYPSQLTTLEAACRDLLADVHRRHPGEELRCPYLRAIEIELDRLISDRASNKIL
jgi:hypothetical protein